MELEIEEITISQKNHELINDLIAINNYAKDNNQSTYSVSDFINTILIKGYKEKTITIPVGFRLTAIGENEKALILSAGYNDSIHNKQSSGNFLLEVRNKENNLNNVINLLEIDSLPKTIASRDIETVLVKDIRQVDPENTCKYVELLIRMAKAYKLMPIKTDHKMYVCFYSGDVFDYRQIDILTASTIAESLFDIIRDIKNSGAANEMLNDFACSTYSIINILNTKDLYQPQKEKLTPVLYL